MKSISKYLLFLSISLFSNWAVAQDSCKVLVKALQGEYQGECKKGLANGNGLAQGEDSYSGEFKKGYPNGNGTYKWSTGEVYSGEWRKGKRDGNGSYSYKENAHDTLIIGLWKSDIFIGKEVKRPDVIYKKNITDFHIQKNVGMQARVLVDFRQNGMQNTRVSNMMLDADSGTPVQMGQKYGFDNVVYPITIKLRYDTYNKLGTQQINCALQITIYEEGEWEIIIRN